MLGSSPFTLSQHYKKKRFPDGSPPGPGPGSPHPVNPARPPTWSERGYGRGPFSRHPLRPPEHNQPPRSGPGPNLFLHDHDRNTNARRRTPPYAERARWSQLGGSRPESATRNVHQTKNELQNQRTCNMERLGPIASRVVLQQRLQQTSTTCMRKNELQNQCKCKVERSRSLQAHPACTTCASKISTIVWHIACHATDHKRDLNTKPNNKI